jgi:integrase
MAKAFLALRKKIAKEPQIIHLGFKFGSSQILYSTGIKILPTQWDFKKGKAKPLALLEISFTKDIQDFSGTIPTTDELNHFLSSLKSEVDNYELQNRESFTKESLRAVLDKFYEKEDELQNFAFDLNKFIQKTIIEAKKQKQNLTKESLINQIDAFLHPPVKGIDLFEYIETFINDSETGRRLIDGGNVHERTIKRYRTTQSILIDFSKKYKRLLDFNTIDIDFYKDFNSFMAKVKDYAPATMGKHVSTLKTFLREATENGINTNLKFQSKAFKVVETESDSIALNVEELNAMYSLDLSNDTRLEKVRDLFIIGANTGLRFSDFTDIKPDNIKKDGKDFVLDIIQYKTKNQVVVPLNKVSLEILQKYDNQLPPAITNQKFNEYIKEIAQMVQDLHEPQTRAITKGGKQFEETVPKWQLVSSHTARRSFATNAYERGTPTISLMQITGHKTEKSFLKYIKTSKKKHSDIVRKHL